MLIAGVDEVGRGPLAGPVVAAAVILDRAAPIDGLVDSKQLTERRRIDFDRQIRCQARAYAIGYADVDEIDQLNILHATMLAMQRAVAGLPVMPDKVYIDGNRVPDLTCDAEAIIGGDAIVAEISAASIIAKVYRDKLMKNLHEQYPHYGFASNKGYPSRQHKQALLEHGVSPIHRRSFAPVRKALENS